MPAISGHLLDGRAWMEPQGFVMSDDDEADPRAPFILGDRRMETQDTLFTWRAGRGRLEGTGFHPVAEAPFRAVAPDGSGVAVVEWTEQEPGELQVRFHAPDGEVTWSWSLEVAPRPLPDALRDSLVAEGREQVAEIRERVIEEEGIPGEQPPEVPSASEVEERAYLPAYKPPVRNVELGRGDPPHLPLEREPAVGRPARGAVAKGGSTASKDVGDGHLEVREHVASGEGVVPFQGSAGRAGAVDGHGARFRVHYPHQPAPGVQIFADFPLDAGGQVRRRDDLDDDVWSHLPESARWPRVGRSHGRNRPLCRPTPAWRGTMGRSWSGAKSPGSSAFAAKWRNCRPGTRGLVVAEGPGGL